MVIINEKFLGSILFSRIYHILLGHEGDSKDKDSAILAVFWVLQVVFVLVCFKSCLAFNIYTFFLPLGKWPSARGILSPLYRLSVLGSLCFKGVFNSSEKSAFCPYGGFQKTKVEVVWKTTCFSQKTPTSDSYSISGFFTLTKGMRVIHATRIRHL